MADSTIPGLVAVTVPALTDLLCTRQSGDTRDKKLTVTQLLSLAAGGGDVSKVGTPVDDQVGVWTGDGTIEGTTGLTYDGSDLGLTGNIVLTGTVDGIDIATDVAANTAKVTNANHSGDATGATALTIAADAVTYAKMQNVVADDRILGNIAGAGGIVAELTGAQINLNILPVFTDLLNGLVPLSGGGITAFLRADGTWVVPAGSGDVSKVGTPADDQVGVWTGDGTIEGTAALTFGAAGLSVDSAGGILMSSGGGNILFGAASTPTILNEAASATNPTLIPNKADLDTGIGLGAVDSLSLISGSVEGLRLAEANSGVIQVPNASVAVTAFAGGGQGSAVQLDESYTVIGTVATAADSVKLPPVFAINSTMYVKNDGANAADVFPASGDDLGAGVDTAVSLEAGKSLSFIATTANSIWTQLLVDTTTVLSGGLLSAEYRFSTTLTAADPGAGRYRYNSATPASVTEIYIDDFTDNGIDISNLLALITTGDRLYFQTGNDSAEFLVFNVSGPITDNTGWFTVDGTVEASGDLHGNNAKCILALQIGGAASGGNVSNTGTPLNNQLAIWIDATTIEGVAALTFDGTILAATRVLTGVGSAALPAVAVGENDTGLYLPTTDVISVTLGGVQIWSLQATQFSGSGDSATMLFASPSATLPSLVPRTSDLDTGIGQAASDQLSLIAGGVEIARASEAAEDQFIISPGALLGSAALPALAFGDGDSGFFESTDDFISISLAGTARFEWVANTFQGILNDAPALINQATAFNVPTLIPSNQDVNTGIGQNADDELSIIAGGVEGLRFIELNSGVIQAPNASLAITAFATGGQGSAVQLDESYSVIGTVATTGDSVKLPPVFIATSIMYIKNDGANAADIFPATGDDLGAGTNIAVSIAAGESKSFIATTDDSIWTQLIVDTSGAGGTTFPEFQFSPLILENPNNADWTVNALAPAAADSNNAGLTIRAFDDTVDEGVGFQFEVPTGATNIVFSFRSRAETTPGGAVTVGVEVYNRGIPDNAAVQAWSSATQLTDLNFTTNEFFQEDSQSVTLATLGVTAGELTQFELVRTAPTGGSDLTGDWILANLKVSFT